MSVAFSTRSLREGRDRLVAGAERARASGFHAIHAAAPPADAAKARVAIETNHLTLTAVSTIPIDDLSILGAAIDRAADAAAALKHRLVVVETGPLAVPRGSTVETAVGTLIRATHAALRRHPGLSLALATTDCLAGVVGARESEWIVSELRGEPVGFWFDTGGALRVERSDGGAPALAWADRFGSRVMGLAVHGLGGGEGHARPEDEGFDWGTLRGLVPAKAPWVLELAPSTPASVIEESRRFVEHVLGQGASR